MKLRYKISVYERAALDAAIYWYRVGRTHYATKVLTYCLYLLHEKVKKKNRGIAQR